MDYKRSKLGSLTIYRPLNQNKNLYDNGLPFDNTLGENIKTQLKRIDNNKASLLIIDGGIGEGKTTLAVHIADHINKLKGKGKISLEMKFHPQIAMGGGGVYKLLSSMSRT